MPRFPHIRKGMDWHQTSAREWNAMSDAAESWANLTTGPGLRLVKRPRGATLELDPHGPGPETFRKRVAIQEVADSHLIVREVVYAGSPPVPGEMSWNREAHVAYPDVGSDFSEFRSFVWGEDDPKLETPILSAYRKAGDWLVILPATVDRMVVLRSFGLNPATGEPDENSRFAIVQDVEPVIVDNVWTGEMETSGEPQTINVWPLMRAGHFRPFIWIPTTLSTLATILPLTLIEGVWWLKQRPKRAVARRQGPVKLLDCAQVDPRV